MCMVWILRLYWYAVLQLPRVPILEKRKKSSKFVKEGRSNRKAIIGVREGGTFFLRCADRAARRLCVQRRDSGRDSCVERQDNWPRTLRARRIDGIENWE